MQPIHTVSPQPVTWPWLLRLSGSMGLVFLLTSCQCGPTPPPSSPMMPPAQGGIGGGLVSTFSVVGFDPATGELGVAVQSKFFNVGSVVPWASADIGAIATQSYANVAYGKDGLELLRAGKSAPETMESLTRADEGRNKRQLGIVDAQGLAASFTGSECNDWAGHHVGSNYCVQGNLLTGPEVVDAMKQAYEATRAKPGTHLEDWLMASLQAGQAAGGDKRGRQSAALLVVRADAGFGGANDRFIDLQVEDHPKPIEELQRLLELHKTFFKWSHLRAHEARKP